jgi:hypothetical protein
VLSLFLSLSIYIYIVTVYKQVFLWEGEDTAREDVLSVQFMPKCYKGELTAISVCNPCGAV